MLVHVDDEIYLLRKDQEKLVSMIFPGRKITSVLALEKDFLKDEISYKIENNYYDFTEDDVNKTLKCLGIMPERQKQDVKSQVVSHKYNTRSKANYSRMSPGKRTREGLETDQQQVKKTKTEINREHVHLAPSYLESLHDYFAQYINKEKNSSRGKSLGI